MIEFEFDKKQVDQLTEWCKAQDKIVLERQRQTMSPDEFDDLTDAGSYAYYGAIGGSITYMLTPTSIGMFVHVKNTITHDVLDLTDYESL